LDKKQPSRLTRMPVPATVEALLEGDYPRAMDLALAARERAGSRVAVFVDLLQPAQYEIGDRWYRGEIKVEDEHRATAVAQRVTESLPPTPSANPVPRTARCLMAAMGDEQHVLGLRQLELAFMDDGWPVVRIGPRAQVDVLADEVRGTDPSLVCISAGYLSSTTPVRRAIAAVKELRIPVLVGGSAFNRSPLLWRDLGADHHGADARVALVLARRLLR